jgi:hypothetical protein
MLSTVNAQAASEKAKIALMLNGACCVILVLVKKYWPTAKSVSVSC